MTYEQQKYAPETIQTPQSSSQEGFKPDLKTKIMSGAKNLKDNAIIIGKDFKTAFNKAKEIANKPKEYVDNFLNKQKVDYRTSTTPTGDNADRQADMKNTVNSTDDLIKTGEQIGAEANAALQNVDIPRSKLVSYNDIMKSDEFKGQRLPYMANAIGTNLANLLTGKDYQSYLKQHNQTMADTYAQNKAARDTAATQANIQDIEAGNKAEMGKQVQMSDAITEQALKRYGLLEDQETKKQILNEIVMQATGKGMDKWNTLSASEKLAAMALMQAYNGDYSVASMVIEKYGDKVFNAIDKLLGINNGANGSGENTGNGQPTATVSNNIVLANGTEITPEEYEQNKGKYIEVPQPNGQPPKIFPVYHEKAFKPNARTDQDVQETIDAIVNNNLLSDDEKIELAKRADGISEENSAWKNYWSSDPSVRVWTGVSNALREKNQVSGLESEITNNYYNLKELEKLKKQVEKSGNELLQTYYNDAYKAATVNQSVADLKQSNDYTTEEKIKYLEDMVSNPEYADIINRNPKLQEKIKVAQQGYEIRQKYNDPLLDMTNSRMATEMRNKNNTWQVTQNGNLVTANYDKSGNLVKGKEVDPASNSFANLKTSEIVKLINSLITSASSDTGTAYSVGGFSPSVKDIQALFKESSEFSTMSKILDNKKLLEKTDNDPTLQESIERLTKVYNSFNR